MPTAARPSRSFTAATALTTVLGLAAVVVGVMVAVSFDDDVTNAMAIIYLPVGAWIAFFGLISAVSGFVTLLVRTTPRRTGLATTAAATSIVSLVPLAVTIVLAPLLGIPIWLLVASSRENARRSAAPWLSGA